MEERRKGGDRRAGKTRVVIVDGHIFWDKRKMDDDFPKAAALLDAIAAGKP